MISDRIDLPYKEMDMTKKSINSLTKEAKYQYQLMCTVTSDQHCYIYSLQDIQTETETKSVKFYEIDFNRKFHFSAGAICTADKYLVEKLRAEVKKIAPLWKKSKCISSCLCAPCGTKREKAKNYFIDSVCYWGRVTRTLPTIRKYFENSENRTQFIETIEKRNGTKGEKAYKNIEEDFSSSKGIGLAIYSKILRIINPSKFFIVDSVYEDFFKKPGDYSKYHEALLNVLEEIKQDNDELKGLKIGDFESILYILIQHGKKNVMNPKYREGWSD